MEVKNYYQSNRAEFEFYLDKIIGKLNGKYDYMEDDCINYQVLKEKVNDIIKKDPIIEKVLYEKEKHSLTVEQVSNLIILLDYQDSMRMLEEKRLFFDGGKEAISYLKLTGAIKDRE